MRKALVACAAVFLAAHLPFLPPTLEDIDSVNFALGVRDFDVARHQPHPPGYPIFIAMARGTTAAFDAAGAAAPEARGLALWSVLAGTALVFLLFGLFRAIGGDARRAWWGTIVAVTSPLLWFTALRPLSDITGLAFAVAAQALLAAVACGRGRPRLLVAGAFLAGFAIGVRSQTFVLTLPLLGMVLVWPGLGLRAVDRVAAVAAASLGILAWGVPLIAASGGLAEYAAALGSQAGEDFSGVVMLWTARSPRVAADALIYSLLWPWGGMLAGAVVTLAAMAGAARLAWGAPRALVVLVVAFLPYAIFHLLFHEVVTVRYALPLVVPAAYLAVVALDVPGRFWLPAGAAALAAASLIVTVPAAVDYGREGSPTFRLLRDVDQIAHPGPGGGAGPDVAFHAVMRRAVVWESASLPARVIKAPHGREWLALLASLRRQPDRPVAFVANPRRTDLALIDPRSRRLVRSYRWPFEEPPFVGGARPGDADLYLIRSPGWVLDRGWALTAEVAGVTARDGVGPHVQPSLAWVRARQAGAVLMLGGRHLGGPGDPAVRLSVSLDGRPVETFDAAPGPFFRVVPLAPGTLQDSRPFLPIEVASAAADGSGRRIPVALEQFDLQSPDVPMIGLAEGWHEPEFNPAMAVAWRWMSGRAALWVRPIGRDVSLTLTGESPLRYFESAPAVTVSIGGQEIARFSPSTDFSQTIVLPAAALASAGGRVVVASDRVFVPGDEDGTADRRQLALRVFVTAVRAR